MFVKGGKKVSHNLLQCLMLTTKQVLTYATLSPFVVTFPVLASSFYVLILIFGVWSLREASGMRHTGCQALCWKLRNADLFIYSHNLLTSWWFMITSTKKLGFLSALWLQFKFIISQENAFQTLGDCGNGLTGTFNLLKMSSSSIVFIYHSRSRWWLW